jgi:hypothetical protein
LYGVNQGKINRPIAQAGFIYKQRPDTTPYKPYQIPVAVQANQPQPTPHQVPQNINKPKVKFTNIFRKVVVQRF